MLAPKEKKSKDFALKLVKNAKNDREKVTIISKWINDNIKYTSSMKNRYRIADDVLKNKKGRCGEYSFLMRAMLNAVDIPCVYVGSRQQNHAWNMVYIDNQWITMDSTNKIIAASPVHTVSTFNWGDAELGILGVNVTTNVKNDKGKLIGYTVDKSYLELVKPYRSGYKFDGWYSANSGGVNLTKKNLIKITPHKVYARWSKKGKVYQITFNKNGGTRLSKSSLKVTQGNEYGKLPTTVRKNYTFKGWYTQKSGGKKVSASTKVNLTKNQTLYAQWSKVKRPGNAVITGKENNKPEQMSIWWKKIRGAAGYQIVYSSDKDFKAVNKVTVTSNKKTIKGLKKGRTYYLKVRAYNVDSMNNKFYGKYSTVTKVKIKK